MNTTSELALIIGGTSGMGKETAKYLLAQGVPVWVTGRGSTSVETAKKELGNGTEGTALELSSVEAISGFVGRIEQETRHIKYLVNAAGYFLLNPFWKRQEKTMTSIWISIKPFS